MKEPKTAYGFKDVLLAPQYSEVRSRSDVDTSIVLSRVNIKLNAPFVSSPMPDVTEWKMAKKLDELGSFGIIHRFLSIDEQVEQIKKLQNCRIRAAAIGVNGDSIERIKALLNAGVNVFCVDVASGHNVLLKEILPQIRELIGYDKHLMTGNVATAEGFEFLENLGSDSIRCGLGSGCFLPETIVQTKCGNKEIQDVKIGDEVLTHKGHFKKVIDTMHFDKDEDVVVINEQIKCTGNHEFYVIHKEDLDKITDDNLHHYTRWIAADELTDEYFLVEAKNDN